MASLAEILAARKASATPPAVVAQPVVDTGMADLAKAVAQEKSPSLDLDAELDKPLGLLNKTILQEAEICTADIIPRIRQLASLSDIQTENEMKLLKAALMANPQAVQLMLPEDIGLLVVALRKITKEAIVAEASKKASKAKPSKDLDISKMSKEDIASVEDF